MKYALFNSQTKEYLKHPHLGIWSVTDRDEAMAMCAAARAYILSLGLDEHIVSVVPLEEH